MVSTSVSKPWPWPDSLDAVTAAPKYHRVLLENDRVRVLEVTIPPGETVPVHTHRWRSVLHLIKWADFIRRDENGVQTLDTRELPPERKIPGISWAEPFPPHSVENIDTVAFEGIAVEIKD